VDGAELGYPTRTGSAVLSPQKKKVVQALTPLYYTQVLQRYGWRWMQDMWEECAPALGKGIHPPTHVQRAAFEASLRDALLRRLHALDTVHTSQGDTPGSDTQEQLLPVAVEVPQKGSDAVVLSGLARVWPTTSEAVAEAHFDDVDVMKIIDTAIDRGVPIPEDIFAACDILYFSREEKRQSGTVADKVCIDDLVTTLHGNADSALGAYQRSKPRVWKDIGFKFALVNCVHAIQMQSEAREDTFNDTHSNSEDGDSNPGPLPKGTFQKTVV